jgi:hypothetical protein
MSERTAGMSLAVACRIIFRSITEWHLDSLLLRSKLTALWEASG